MTFPAPASMKQGPKAFLKRSRAAPPVQWHGATYRTPSAFMAAITSSTSLPLGRQMETAEHQEYLAPESLLDRADNPLDAGMGAAGYNHDPPPGSDNQ
jgi:hypothetical protein